MEWRRLGRNPFVGVRRVAHTHADTIGAHTPETVEAIRPQLDPQNAALVGVLAYEGLRPAEAYAFVTVAICVDRTGAAASGSRRSSAPVVPYFRSYDLRHTCATLLLYEGPDAERGGRGISGTPIRASPLAPTLT